MSSLSDSFFFFFTLFLNWANFKKLYMNVRDAKWSQSSLKCIYVLGLCLPRFFTFHARAHFMNTFNTLYYNLTDFAIYMRSDLNTQFIQFRWFSFLFALIFGLCKSCWWCFVLFFFFGNSFQYTNFNCVRSNLAHRWWWIKLDTVVSWNWIISCCSSKLI